MGQQRAMGGLAGVAYIDPLPETIVGDEKRESNKGIAPLV